MISSPDWNNLIKKVLNTTPSESNGQSQIGPILNFDSFSGHTDSVFIFVSIDWTLKHLT